MSDNYLQGKSYTFSLILICSAMVIFWSSTAFAYQNSWEEAPQQAITIVWQSDDTYTVQAAHLSDELVSNNIKVPFNSNNVRVLFSGQGDKANGYKFRLANFEDDWSYASTTSRALYNNLPPGKYEFEVIPLSGDNHRPQLVSVGLEIVAPIWRQWWFYSFVGILAIGLLVLYNNHRVNYRIEMLLRKEKEREEKLKRVHRKMARDFHDELGNKLASIGVSADLVGLKLQNNDMDIARLLERIQVNTKSLFDGTKDFLWSIDPSSDNIFETFTYLKDYGEDYFARASVNFFAQAPNTTEPYYLAEGDGRQILMILKEAMRRSAPMSQTVHLQLELQHNAFEFVLESDRISEEGKMLAAKDITTMTSKAKQIKCSLSLHQSENNLVFKLRGNSIELPKQQPKDKLKTQT